jgi:hypothetical protein
MCMFGAPHGPRPSHRAWAHRCADAHAMQSDSPPKHQGGVLVTQNGMWPAGGESRGVGAGGLGNFDLGGGGGGGGGG